MGEHNPYDLPWTIRGEDHLGTRCASIASIIDCKGDRVAVGLRPIDAELIVQLANASAKSKSSAKDTAERKRRETGQ